MAELAVIIVTHNSQDVLPRCLDALSRQTIQADIVLVDSGSKDVSYLDAYRMRSGIRVILEENIGFSRANNRGCQALSQAAEFIL
ncbi:Glycosyl transferase family 2, partial [Candidatus Electrothrix marina]